MLQALAVAVLAGLTSAMFSGGISPGSLLTLLAIAAPLPLMLAGFAWHPLVAALGGLIGCILISLIMHPVSGAIYGLSIALPAYLATEFGRRRLSDLDADAYVLGRWLGRGLMLLVLYAALVSVAPPLLVSPDFATFTSEFRNLSLTMLQQVVTSNPEAGVSAEALAGIADFAAQLILPILAATIVAMHAFSIAVAFGLTERAGRLPFVKPDLGLTRLPPGSLVVLGGSLALSGSEGYLGAFATAVLIGMALGFTLLGLAVLHVRTRARPLRGVILLLAWSAVIILFFPAAFFAGVGLIDHVFDLRRPRVPPKVPPARTPPNGMAPH